MRIVKCLKRCYCFKSATLRLRRRADALSKDASIRLHITALRNILCYYTLPRALLHGTAITNGKQKVIRAFDEKWRIVSP